MPLVYEIGRYDSLFYQASVGETAQASDKTGLLTAHPSPGQENGLVEVVLQSMAAAAGTRLSVASLDSAVGARWRMRLGQFGLEGETVREGGNVLTEQVGVIVALLFPQLPYGGLRPMATWSDSARYPLRVDAFDAVESAVRSSRAAAVPNGLRIEAVERLDRKGGATQGGQVMSLAGGGERRLSYEFASLGFLTWLSATDSLDLRVRVSATGEVIPVRWRSTLSARLRGAPPR
jgi:hypothetical protein